MNYEYLNKPDPVTADRIYEADTTVYYGWALPGRSGSLDENATYWRVLKVYTNPATGITTRLWASEGAFNNQFTNFESLFVGPWQP